MGWLMARRRPRARGAAPSRGPSPKTWLGMVSPRSCCGIGKTPSWGACIRDTQAGVSFLEGLGFQRIALVGHSFSGAVVISVAPLSRAIVAVVALASQTLGANSVAHIHPRPLLLVHGTQDQRLNCYCSEQIYSWAKKPKELVILEGASHGLWECKDDLLPLLHRWLTDKLSANVLKAGDSVN